jgi:protein-tyrosine phosphatase
MDQSSTNSENNNAVDNGSGGNNYWGWLSTAAAKAQEFAETAKRVAIEQSQVIAKQAEELKQKYDLEVASSILMGGSGTASSSQNTHSDPDTIKLTKAELSQLDMIYITENLLAMAFPREKSLQSSGHKRNSGGGEEGGSGEGNDINVVAAYLRKKHLGKFMIWNISEESYDYTKFNDQVLEYKFPGHPAPPLGLLFKICTSIESWLDADDNNIAIIHCLTGKGRTATLMACVLTWIGEFDSPMSALQYVAQRRSTAVDYLTIPSQRRYIQYFSNLLDGVKPSSEPLLLRRIIINSIPAFGYMNPDEATSLGCCPYIQLFKNGKLVASSAAVSEKASPVANNNGDSNGNPLLQLRWVTQAEGSATFKIDCIVQGDVLIRCRHATLSGSKVSMFRAAFHTGYVSGGVLRLTKAQLDGSATDSRFAEDFFVDFVFSPVDSSSLTDTTNKDLLDAASQDKYESGLHKDAKFWDSVTARKNKGKKRKSRKFTADQYDPFSIIDDSKVSHGTDHDEISFNFSSKFASGLNNSSNDMELIKQLAQAEGDDDDVPSSVQQSSAPVVKGELEALEDLEKELGLSDLQLFSNEKLKPSSSNLTEAPASKPPATSQGDDDNLDELERYLQSLSSQN